MLAAVVDTAAGMDSSPWLQVCVLQLAGCEKERKESTLTAIPPTPSLPFDLPDISETK